jgi:dUTP pyrophosphatase
MGCDMELRIYRIDKRNPLPQYMSEGASGIDLYASLNEPVILQKGEYKCIPTGIIISLPTGFEAQIRPRSGLAATNGVTILNAPGTVDSDYRGEIKVLLINHGNQPFVMKSGMRIAQLVVCRVEKAEIIEVTSLRDTSVTERNNGGFGHTGV